MNIIFKRKSVRTYLDIDVDDATVEQIIRAGMAAPSAKNQRPWEFYVVRNKETLAKLATCTPYARPVANAPVAIVACYRTKGIFEPMMTLLDIIGVRHLIPQWRQLGRISMFSQTPLV